MGVGPWGRLGSALAVLALGLLSPQAGPARAEAPITLEEALARATKSHPELVRVRASLEAETSRVEAIGAALRPELGAEASASVGASPPLDLWDPVAGLEAGIVFGWTLSDFGRTRATERAARAAVDAQSVSIGAIERDIALAVEEAFYQAVAVAELVKVAVVNYEAEKRHREEAERFVAAGQRAAIEVARARTQEARARTEVVRAEAAARQALVFLARAMGTRVVPSAVSLEWPGVGEGEAAAEGALDAVVDQAIEARVEVKAARARVEAAKASIEVAETGLFPVLRASARVGVTSRDVTDKESWGPSWAAGLVFAWPFLDGGRTESLVAAARADLRASEATLQELDYRIGAEVKTQEVALLSAGAEIEAASAAREAAAVELRLAEARWREGLGSGIELADAQARLTATDAERTRALLSHALALARLKRALGP